MRRYCSLIARMGKEEEEEEEGIITTGRTSEVLDCVFPEGARIREGQAKKATPGLEVEVGYC